MQCTLLAMSSASTPGSRRTNAFLSPVGLGAGQQQHASVLRTSSKDGSAVETKNETDATEGEEVVGGVEGQVLPNKGVHADGGDAIQRLDGSLDLVLVSADVADEHKRLQAGEKQGDSTETCKSRRRINGDGGNHIKILDLLHNDLRCQRVPAAIVKNTCCSSWRAFENVHTNHTNQNSNRRFAGSLT